MKKTAACSLIAATAALLSLASPAKAGVLTLDESSPTFTPPGDFSNNTIVANTIVVGGLIDLTGDVTVTPAESDVAMVGVTGTYLAEMGDEFSVAYKFAADLNAETAVDFTLSGTIEIMGVPLSFETTGTIDPGLHVYEGTVAQPSPFLLATAGNFSGTLTLDFSGATPGSVSAPSAAAPGTLDLSVQQIDFKLDPLPAAVTPPAQPQNISTRANVGTGDDVLIGGIIITGNDSKQVVVRAIGPSSGVAGALADPTLELHDSTGAIIATNDNWMDNSAADQMILTDSGLAPGNDLESALVVNPSPGSYTAIVRGVDDTTGIALVEAYDLDNGTTDSKLGNISTRGFVDTGDNVMIGGFILGGGGGGFAQIIVRGIGPSLADFGVTGALADPTISLFDSDGNEIASNDNWMDDPNMQTVADRGLAPSDPNESAIYDVLPIGAYTVILSGVGDTTGIALVEAYDVDNTVGPSGQ
jgi:hypothetical protein